MHTFLSSYCLETMGIQVWRQCREFSGASQTQNFEAYGLHSILGTQLGMLCLESLPIQAEQAAPVFHLLEAMLSAIKLKYIPLLDNHILQKDSFILLMGQSLAQKALGSQDEFELLRVGNIHTHISGAKLLVTYHPLDLLIEPTKKIKAWDDLKKLKQALC